MSGSQTCRGSPHGPIENEMRHLKAEKNKSFWIFTEPDTISLFCLPIYMYFLFILLSHLVLCSNPIMIIFSVGGHHLAFLYDRT